MSSFHTYDNENILKRIPGIYCWTDDSRAQHTFKLGMSNDLLFRLEHERCKASNTGTLLYYFILECEERKDDNEEEGEKIKKIILSDCVINSGIGKNHTMSKIKELIKKHA